MLLMWSREKMSATNDPADFLPGNDNKEEHDRRDATGRGTDKENFDVACRAACWFVIPRSHIAFPSPPRSLSGSACLVNTEHARSDPFTAKPDGEREGPCGLTGCVGSPPDNALFWPGEIKCGGALVDHVGDLKENICGPLLISSYRILIARQMLAWEGSDLSPRPIYKWFRGTAPCRPCRFKVVHLFGECVAVTRFLHSFIRVSE